MSPALGHVNKVLRFSLVDGPGNRFVVFLQGCNFNCIACHNPYTINLCDGCDQCVEPCPEHALMARPGKVPLLNAELCTECDVCMEVCPSDSTPLATMVEVDALVNQIAKVAPFLSGVTVSGGEATLQPTFVAALFAELRERDATRHLSTLVDSNGSANRKTWDSLLPVMDGAMLDLKALDPATHRLMTGSDNSQVLDSIVYLAGHHKLTEIRLLLLPGRNDSPEIIEATAGWLRQVDPNMRIKLIGFRQHGVRDAAASTQALDGPAPLPLAEADPAHVEAMAEIVRSVGFSDVVVV